MDNRNDARAGVVFVLVALVVLLVMYLFIAANTQAIEQNEVVAYLILAMSGVGFIWGIAKQIGTETNCYNFYVLAVFLGSSVFTLYGLWQ